MSAHTAESSGWVCMKCRKPTLSPPSECCGASVVDARSKPEKGSMVRGWGWLPKGTSADDIARAEGGAK